MPILDRLRRAGVVLATTANAVPASASGYSHSSYSHHDRNDRPRYRKVCKTVWKKVGHGRYKKWKRVHVCYYVPVHRYSYRR
jgi:hypothetical protein